MRHASRWFLWLGVVVLPAWLAAGDAEGVVFTDATASAGILYPLPVPIPIFVGSPVSQTGGAAAGDFDNDGWPDLFITRHWDAPILYRNNQNGTFSDVTAGAFTGGLPGPKSTAGSWGDIDNDGDLDLYVPTVYNDSGSYLYVNDGTGHFTEQAAARHTNLGGPSIVSTSASFGDYDNDGYLDMYVGEWRAFSSTAPPQARLLHNRGATQPGYFEDVTAASGAAMGLAIGDIDGNGLLDWLTTDIYSASDSTTGNRLFRNYENRLFLESAVVSGVRDAGWGWGAEMFDYDNDSDLDIVATNGFYFSGAQRTDQVRLWANNGLGGFLTTFTDVAASVGITDTSQGRGLLKFDYDRDGDLDVFIVNNFDTPILYRNDGGNEEGDWLQIKTRGTLSNADGVGAFITVTPDLAFPNKKLVHEISLSSSFLSQSEPIAHFGLGANSDLIDLIRIEWPASGLIQELHNVAPNQLLTIVEPRPGDFDYDGDVDGRDFLVWQRGGSSNPLSASDLAEWQANFGAALSMATSVAVPEPASLVMAGLSLVGALGLRRKVQV